MKRVNLLWLAVAAVVMASCGGQSADELSKKQIRKQCNKKLVEMGIDSSTVTIQTGYYELNDANSRLQLEKLKAAGIINYEVERYAWWNTKKEKKTTYRNVDYYYTWTGNYAYTRTEPSTKWVTTYDFDEHFMVKVSLTDAAKKYELSHQPLSKPKNIEDRDFKQPVYYDSLYPENQVNQLSENWPEVPHPLSEETYKKCKDILAETNTLLGQDTNNNYSKAEQKLNSLDKVDNYNYMTSVQKNEIQTEKSALQQRIDVLKGNEAYQKAKTILEEATALLSNAKDCKDVTKANKKASNFNSISNYGNMSSSQSTEIKSLSDKFTQLADHKGQELGCNEPAVSLKPQIEEPEMDEYDEYEEPDDDSSDPQAIAYERAKNNEEIINTVLFAYVKKVIVARDIKIGQNDGGTTATAEVICKISDATDVARVMNHVIKGMRAKGTAKFTFTNDKGWTIEEVKIDSIGTSCDDKVSTPNIRNFSGTIGNNQVCMTLSFSSDGTVKGAYYYRKNGSGNLLFLEGDYDEQEVNLTETNKNGKQTGNFNAEWSDNNNKLSGSFNNPIKGTTFNLSLRADNSMQTIDLSNL